MTTVIVNNQAVTVTPSSQAVTVAPASAALVEAKQGSWGLVIHGDDATIDRPSGWGGIVWIGSVQPDNAADSDIVFRTDEVVS